MEPHDQSPDLDPLMRQAIAWLVRMKSGEATVSDAREFKIWRDHSPEHEAALKRAMRLWRTFEAAAAETPVEQDKYRLPLSSYLDRISTRRALLGGAIAAAAAGYLVVRPPLGLWPSLEELSADYRTGKGQQLKVALGGGVALDLGTLTSIVVQSESEIRLIDGEAAIAASTPADRPLVVLAADGRISTTQADFDARCVDDIVSVTCAGGSLEVRQRDRTVQLHAGQRVAYSSAGLGAIVDIDVAQATAWRTGVLIFNHKPLGDVVQEINRYRSGRIFITSDALRARIVNGTFHRDQLDHFIAQVKQLFGAKITTLPGGVTLLS